MKYIPRECQLAGEDHLQRNKFAGLFMDMGLGKTVTVLTVLNRLIKLDRAKRVLIIGTKRVARDTWPDEIEKWDHTRDINYTCLVGLTTIGRRNELKKKHTVTIINCDLLGWLVAYFNLDWPFETVIIDESSLFKNSSSLRFRAMCLIRKRVKRMYLLTGSPAPNGLIDVWSQLFLLDGGKRLGDKKSKFVDKYFELDRQVAGNIRLYKIRKSDNALLGEGIYEREIYSKIEDICISMDTADHVKLPEKVVNYVKLRLPDDVRRQYEQFEKDKVLELLQAGEEKAITAVNAVSLSGKLLQFANGAVYDTDKVAHTFHDVKLDALEEIIEEANGKSVLVSYWFAHDKQRILARLKKYGARVLDSSKDIKDWNAKKIRVGLLHPMSGGHGLNLQFGGNHMVFFGLPNWNLDLHDQMIKRIWRPGLDGTFYLHYLIIRGSIEPEMIRGMRNKATVQTALLKALKIRTDKYIRNIA